MGRDLVLSFVLSPSFPFVLKSKWNWSQRGMMIIREDVIWSLKSRAEG
jgi:hypothetical protein